MPKISIVIPAYNVGDYLQECLDSVRNQTFSDIEAIVVNDASPDNVGEVAAQAAAQDARIRVVTNNPNMGTHPHSHGGRRKRFRRIHVLP